MKKLLFVSLIFILNTNIFTQDSTKKFVSTIGSKIFLKENSQFFSKYGVIKISSIEEKNKFIEVLKNDVLYEKNNHKMMVNLLLMQIENRDYTHETIFLIYTPPTFNVELSQPYYYDSEPENLIFDVKTKGKDETERFSSIRIYLLKEDKIDFKKYFINDTMMNEMAIEEL
jgi:hypothetical protein